MKALALSAILFAAAGPALAGTIVVTDAWSPAAPPAAPTHAAFLTLTNRGDQTRALIAVSAAGYAMAHMHESRMSGGVMTMTAVHQLDVPAGATITFQPGGLHVMLMSPQGTRKPGDLVSLSLEFANGETVPVTATVRKAKMHTAHGGS